MAPSRIRIALGLLCVQRGVLVPPLGIKERVLRRGEVSRRLRKIEAGGNGREAREIRKLFLPPLTKYPYSHYQYLIDLSYDGSSFSGWQSQTPNGNPHRNESKKQGKQALPTIQEILCRGLAKSLKIDSDIASESLCLRVAGRTDAGVHARCQKASFFSRNRLNPNVLPSAINRVLPPSLRVNLAREVPPDFHPRSHTLTKTYAYTLHTDDILPPLLRITRFHVPRPPLNLSLLAQGAKLMEQETSHNFLAFSGQREKARGEGRGGERGVESVEIQKVSGGLEIRVKGKGFLYHQVRHMVGALILVSQSKMSLETLRKILESSPEETSTEFKPSWRLPPPQGLCLEMVEISESTPSACLPLMYPELRHDERGWVTSRVQNKTAQI